MYLLWCLIIRAAVVMSVNWQTRSQLLSLLGVSLWRSQRVVRYGRMKQEYRKVVKFFGEDPTKMRIDDFFGSFTAFITDFEVCSIAENDVARAITSWVPCMHAREGMALWNAYWSLSRFSHCPRASLRTGVRQKCACVFLVIIADTLYRTSNLYSQITRFRFCTMYQWHHIWCAWHGDSPIHSHTGPSSKLYGTTGIPENRKR